MLNDPCKRNKNTWKWLRGQFSFQTETRDRKRAASSALCPHWLHNTQCIFRQKRHLVTIWPVIQKLVRTHWGVVTIVLVLQQQKKKCCDNSWSLDIIRRWAHIFQISIQIVGPMMFLAYDSHPLKNIGKCWMTVSQKWGGGGDFTV